MKIQKKEENNNREKKNKFSNLKEMHSTNLANLASFW